MSLLEILLLALGLSFDTLAVSVVGGMCIDSPARGRSLGIICTFGLVQAALLLLGWLLGGSFVRYIEAYDHWVAFALLALIGGNMILEAFKPSENKSVDLLNPSKLLLAAVATSIDALAVGISLAALQFDMRRITLAAAIVFAVTAAASLAGLKGGKWLSRWLGRKTGLIGGLILVAIGIKILAGHLAG